MNVTRFENAGKRVFDAASALVGLLVLWPVIVACALVARAETGGSGIFRQPRIGRYGRPFHVLKIRTMRVDTLGTTITVANDERITRSGRVFRRFKLDELPQLWNVLVGDMSLVGPRPDVAGYADRLADSERKILSLRPGVTGPATIKYRNEEKILADQSDPAWFNDCVLYPDKVRLNLDYLETYRFRDDIRYILMTLGLIDVPPHLTPQGPEREP